MCSSAAAKRTMFEVEEGLMAPFLSLDDVLTNKLLVGRPQDLADADRLTKMKKIGLK